MCGLHALDLTSWPVGTVDTIVLLAVPTEESVCDVFVSYAVPTQVSCLRSYYPVVYLVSEMATAGRLFEPAALYPPRSFCHRGTRMYIQR